MIGPDSGPAAMRIAERVWRQRKELFKVHVPTGLFTGYVSTDLWYELLHDGAPNLYGERRVFDIPLEHDHTLPDDTIVLRYEVKA